MAMFRQGKSQLSPVLVKFGDKWSCAGLVLYSLVCYRIGDVRHYVVLVPVLRDDAWSDAGQVIRGEPNYSHGTFRFGKVWLRRSHVW